MSYTTFKSFRRSCKKLSIISVATAALFFSANVLAATYTVTNTNTSGPGSLPQAVLDANANPGLDTVNFNIPSSDPNCDPITNVCTISSLDTAGGPPGTFLYGVQGSSQTLYKMDFAGNILGSAVINVSNIRGLSVNPTDNMLYVVGFAGGQGILARITDPSTGAIQVLTPTGTPLPENIADIAFGSDGTLYGVRAARSGELYRITISGNNYTAEHMANFDSNGFGESLGWHYPDNRLYHINQHGFEYINDISPAGCNLASCPTTKVVNGNPGANPVSLLSIGNNGFLLGRWEGSISQINHINGAFGVSLPSPVKIDGLATLPVFTGDYSFPETVPIITDSVVIDGLTQAGASSNHLLIEIKGNQFQLQGPDSSGSTIKGLVINEAPGDGIKSSDNSFGHTIEYNFIGTDPTGTSARPNSISGINLDSGRSNIIRNNLLSGNKSWGAFTNEHYSIIGNGSNVIENNKVGTDITGTLPLPNGAGFGSWVGGNTYNNNIIAYNLGAGIDMRGDTQLWQIASTITNNQIYDNGGIGIILSSYDNTVMNNHIYGNASHGIDIRGKNELVSMNTIYANDGLGIAFNDLLVFNDSTSVDFTLIIGTDMTQPGDAVIGSSLNYAPNCNNVPNSCPEYLESPNEAIDNNVYTKYLNRDLPPVGFTVTPSDQAGIVAGMAITSANDVPGRDPKEVKLYGSNASSLPAWNDASWTLIATVSDIAFNGRFEKQGFQFSNSTAYKHYKFEVT